MAKTILYIHGLAGNEESKTGRIIASSFPSFSVLHPGFSSDPLREAEEIRNIIDIHHPDLIVGSSLGGFFALLQKGFPRIVINPVMKPREDILLSSALVERPRPETIEEDGLPFYAKENYIRKLEGLWDAQKPIDEDPGMLIGCFGDDGSGFFDHYEDFRFLFPSKEAIRFPSSHVLTEEAVKKYVLPLIEIALC